MALSFDCSWCERLRIFSPVLLLTRKSRPFVISCCHTFEMRWSNATCTDEKKYCRFRFDVSVFVTRNNNNNKKLWLKFLSCDECYERNARLKCQLCSHRTFKPWKVKFHSYVSKHDRHQVNWFTFFSYAIDDGTRHNDRNLLIWMTCSCCTFFTAFFILGAIFFYSKLAYAHRLNIALVFSFENVTNMRRIFFLSFSLLFLFVYRTFRVCNPSKSIGWWRERESRARGGDGK